MEALIQSKEALIIMRIILAVLLLASSCLTIIPLSYSSQLEAIRIRRKIQRAQASTTVARDRYVADHIGGKLAKRLDEAYKYSRFYVGKKHLDTSYKYFKATLMASAVFLVIGFLWAGAEGGIAGFALAWILAYGYLEVLRVKNSTEIRSDMIHFLNLLGAYSTGNNEIVSTFITISQHLKPCLVGCLLECVAESQNAKGIDVALENLGRKIENRKFKEILKNIAVTSKYSSDFSETVLQLRQDVTTYLSDQESLTQMIRGNCAIMGVCVVAMLIAVGVAGSLNNENLFVTVVTTGLGKFCTVLFFGVLGYFILKMMEAKK